MKIYKFITYVPTTHADRVREAIAQAGAGVIGAYTHCSFSVMGVGRFIPGDGAHPAIGSIGQIEQVVEEQIITDVSEEKIQDVILALKKSHPYEEVVYDLFEKVTF